MHDAAQYYCDKNEGCSKMTWTFALTRNSLDTAKKNIYITRNRYLSSIIIENIKHSKCIALRSLNPPPSRNTSIVPRQRH